MQWVWRFTIQTEQLTDGSWRAWYPSGGWSVTADTENQAKERANEEGVRRREDPDEVARRVSTMRRHLIDPVAGVSNFDKSVLSAAWQREDPATAVRELLGDLD